jgi:predicted nucleic acid-binding protein
MKVALDTNVLIHFFRHPEARQSFEAKSRRPLLFLSSVVITELLAGCRTKPQQSALEQFVKPFEKADRIIVPDHATWLESGKTLARMGIAGADANRQRRLFNDILIAVSAYRRGAIVVTANAADFTYIEQFTTVRWQHPS